MNHEYVKREIRDILRFYGFKAEEEAPARIPEGGMGRVDVVGYKDGISIGVEIVESGDVARDAKKLAMNKYTYKYIVVLEPSKRVEEVMVGYERIKVLTSPLSFEHELRMTLAIPPTHPYYSSTKIPDVSVLSRTSKTQELLEELEESGLENFADDIMNSLVMIYIPELLPVEIRVNYNPVTGPIRGRPEYEPVNIQPQILAILTRLNLVSTHRNGSGYHRKTIAKLTSRGKEIAREIIMRRIKENKSQLEDMIRKYGNEIWIVLQGSVVDRVDWTGAIYPAESDEKRKDILEVAKYCGDPFIGESELSKYAPNSVVVFCEFLAKTSLRDFALRFFEKLEGLGLAVREYSYDSRMRPINLNYYAPKEVLEFFLARTSPPANFDYYVQRFSAYYVLINSALPTPSVARKRYEELMKALEVPERIVAEVLNDMNRRGITSRLITKKDRAPFVILDEEGFREYLRSALRLIASIGDRPPEPRF
ncbi:hypothetical protein A3L12_02375 [Thermococcus sp. P6]|uniref:hypothetical protein n=1 Tax=Thermococcus sp. P6 TaxID=122420 RepID=UPI000B59EF19|nr:hypothetical protein [Thermococcus sp. P6]ASJ10220.1 hypothetical protein A3L12_02375 [Thermococcus sp. P6]